MRAPLLVQVYVSETWKFIFVRNPKSSSTAIIAAIKNQLCNRSCSDEQFRQVRVMQQLTAKWDSYFVFTVVRNPWLRGLSAYGMFTKSFLRRSAARRAPVPELSRVAVHLQNCPAARVWLQSAIRPRSYEHAAHTHRGRGGCVSVSGP